MLSFSGNNSSNPGGKAEPLGAWVGSEFVSLWLYFEKPPNLRMKLTACGTLTRGKNRRCLHAAAYPHR
jgi:hypothetical protein